MAEASPIPPQRQAVRRTPPRPDELRADVWIAGGLIVAAIISAWLGLVAGVYGTDASSMTWGLVYAVAVSAPLALRRRVPTLALALVAIAFFAGVTFRIPDLYVGNIALFIAMFTVGAWVDDRRRATLVRVLVITGMLVWLLVMLFQSATAETDEGFSRAGLFSPFAAFALLQLLVNVAFFGGAYYLGDRAHASALSRRTLEERTAELERERELTAAQAVALDRVSIARELHDVVAHHVSAMGVQAGAARSVLDRDPSAARDVLVGIEGSARDALGELRNLLDTLRRPGGEAGPGPETEGASTLRLDAIAGLVAHASDNGLPTTFAVLGRPVSAPDVVQVNLYRIAQEALTNARRHGGAEATADVRLRYDPDAIELEITNTGSVRATGRAGLGLVGMRERAAASGGVIETGPRPRGGYLVRVRVPLTSRSAVLA
ncbi:sensor histidine kinase [Microbacterium ulmi]|uniref:histidine kinase n=1 Tax=Microbacterium ulmi TaxID=179095 RepID=A0A7Y2PZX5_9MICO|nr:histidine kinase [Microbacterium ulmi]NII69220.1 signal transduction histidine kinase [Microbacterium ulmi]NNH03758.1 sensor histidine kinase [Microbacterium ulmi]